METAEIVIVGAGVQGASLAFHLARRGAQVTVLERETVAAGATGRSSGLVRMHYDLESEARLAWASFPYFRDWAGHVGAGECGFVRTGFVQLVPAGHADDLRANVEMHQRIGITTRLLDGLDIAKLLPGTVIDDIVAAAYEPDSGYADPSGTASGFIAAARRLGSRVIQGCQVRSVVLDGDRVVGVDTDRGRISSPIVVDAAGAWAAELARTAGVELPIDTWRHETAYFGLPTGRSTDFPVVIDGINGTYFRPEGRELMLVGLEAGNEVGGSPDRPRSAPPAGLLEDMIGRVCARLPWMAGGTLRQMHGGQDGITPDQRAIIDRVGPEGFYVACGFSGTGFKTAPAIGASLAELILDGRSTTADLSDFSLRRFAEGRPLIGEHPYDVLWT